MASLVSMTSRAMMAKLHRNTEVKVTDKAFSSINTLHLLRESEFHCSLVLTRNASTTLEKTKLDFQAQHEHATARISGEVQLGKGGCEGNGSKNRNGGDDDDDYFHHFNVQAILQEWGTTSRSLPGEIRQAVEMKTISSAQMVGFLSTNARPTSMTRTSSRMSPESVSRAFMGRILADPAFLHKLLFDEMVTIACALWREFEHRRDMKEEWDVVVVNVLTSVASTACTNWALAPSRSFASRFKFEFQKALQKLLYHVFEKSIPLREFDMAKKVLRFAYKTDELGLLGLVIGALASVMLFTRGQNVSALLFSVNRRACGCGAFLRLSGNLVCQVVFELERLMQDHFEHLRVVLLFSAILRAFNLHIGDARRVTFWGQGEVPIVVHDHDLQPYRRETRRVSFSWHKGPRQGWQARTNFKHGWQEES